MYTYCGSFSTILSNVAFQSEKLLSQRGNQLPDLATELKQNNMFWEVQAATDINSTQLFQKRFSIFTVIFENSKSYNLTPILLYIKFINKTRRLACTVRGRACFTFVSEITIYIKSMNIENAISERTILAPDMLFIKLQRRKINFLSWNVWVFWVTKKPERETFNHKKFCCTYILVNTVKRIFLKRVVTKDEKFMFEFFLLIPITRSENKDSLTILNSNSWLSIQIPLFIYSAFFSKNVLIPILSKGFFISSAFHSNNW